MADRNSLQDPESLAQEFKDFAYSVSHDLNAPLRAVVEFSRLLKSEQENALSAEGKQYLSLILQSGEKLQTMIGKLLDYSRLNTDAVQLTSIDCNALVAKCRDALKENLEKSGAVIEAENLPNIIGNEKQIFMLFMSLLENGLKFRMPGKPPMIHLSAQKEQNKWIFLVTDKGIGIDPKFHKSIFRIFTRLHGDADYPGIGMGLALAKRIIECHGGDIRVESAPDQGACFKFSLPVVGENA